jgi:hypothetical protein
MNDQKKLLASCFPHLQGIDGGGQMGSGLLRHVRALAHDWGQVLIGNLAECSNENTGLRAIASNIQLKKFWLNVRTHFGLGVFGGSSF